MKRLLILGALVAVFFAGCEVTPYADFETNTITPQPNETVRFTNLSDRATSVEWDFGDGSPLSTAFNPTYTYKKEGVYKVTLTAYSKDGNIDRASIDLEVFYNLELEIAVAEWNEQNIPFNYIADANVRLYPTLLDWDNQTNMVVEGYTDLDGYVVFGGLAPKRYYVDVWHSYYNNYYLRDDDPSLVTTQPLIQFYNNSFLAWVDYVPSKNSKEDEYRRNNIVDPKINRAKRTLLVVDVSK